MSMIQRGGTWEESAAPAWRRSIADEHSLGQYGHRLGQFYGARASSRSVPNSGAYGCTAVA
eukprot:1456292-Rhodomonas_salina.1